jgi:hypothetical protein
MTTTEATELIKECRRQEESCLYTSTTLYHWLRSIRLWRSTFIAAPIILGSVGSWALLKGVQAPLVVWFTAACSLLAGMFPAIFKALELDGRVADVSQQAALFKNLQDRFRQAANFGVSKSIVDVQTEFEALMKQLEAARTASITPPERFFRSAQRKIKTGHYDFSVDETVGPSTP